MAQKRHFRFLSVTALGTMAAILCTTVSGAAAPPKRPPPKNQGCSAWQDDFTGDRLDASRWVIASGGAPGYIPGRHIGYYQPSNVSMGGGMLRLELTQEVGPVDTNPAGIISNGALIYTKQTCGYGTYEWTMRMSSTAENPSDPGDPISGSVSAGFLYVNNSQTEIDFEFSALNPDTLWLVNWLNTNPHRDPTSSMETYTALYPFDSISSFHTYTFIWQPGKITYYIDGRYEDAHTSNVPSAPAYFMINHWGTDSGGWGGMATIGITRYFFIDHVSYTPPQ